MITGICWEDVLDHAKRRAAYFLLINITTKNSGDWWDSRRKGIVLWLVGPIQHFEAWSWGRDDCQHRTLTSNVLKDGLVSSRCTSSYALLLAVHPVYGSRPSH